MNSPMTSRERTLAAIAHEQADRVPIHFRQIVSFNHLWADDHERVDTLLGMGADACVRIGIGPCVHEDVRIRDWFDDASDPDYRLACREYETPAGTLRTVMRCTKDCSYAGGVPLASDHNISRGVEHLVKSREDLPKLKYLLQRPGKEDIAAFRRGAVIEKRFADQRGIVLVGDGGPGGDLAFWLCGENIYYLQQDDPDFVRELLSTIYSVDIECLDIVLAEGVDIVDARGCYETVPMWSPSHHAELFVPGLKRKTSRVHQAGAVFSYFSAGDFVPHADALLEAEIDVINSVRPDRDANDMSVLKGLVGDRICLWGGINPEVTIEQGTPNSIRAHVADVLLAAGQGGGLVLSTGGSIWSPDCYNNVASFIESAVDLGAYPMDVAALGRLSCKVR